MHSTLENIYFLSQIVLTVIAGLAAYGAYAQLQTMKKFEFLKILESENVREARRKLYFELVKNPPKSEWWWNDPDTEKAASTVCASFDIVGIMAQGQNWKFFTTEWSRPICWTYRVLEPYIAARSPGGYHGFRELFRDAVKNEPSKPRTDASSMAGQASIAETT